MTATRWLRLKVTKAATNHCLCFKDVGCHLHLSELSTWSTPKLMLKVLGLINSFVIRTNDWRMVSWDGLTSCCTWCKWFRRCGASSVGQSHVGFESWKTKIYSVIENLDQGSVLANQSWHGKALTLLRIPRSRSNIFPNHLRNDNFKSLKLTF